MKKITVALFGCKKAMPVTGHLLYLFNRLQSCLGCLDPTCRIKAVFQTTGLPVFFLWPRPALVWSDRVTRAVVCLPLPQTAFF